MYEIFEQLLQSKGVTAYQVSKETGISQATISSWKKGTYTPKQDKLQKIANFFGVSVDYLIGRSVDSAITPKETGPARPADKVIIYHRDGKTKEEYLTKEQLEYVSKFIESIKDIKPKEDL